MFVLLNVCCLLHGEIKSVCCGCSAVVANICKSKLGKELESCGDLEGWVW